MPRSTWCWDLFCGASEWGWRRRTSTARPNRDSSPSNGMQGFIQPSITLVDGADYAGHLGQNADDAGDDQVGTLDLRAAVCADGGAAGGEWAAGLADSGVDSGGHGVGALGGDGLQPLGG